jgi:alpha-ribazole phosphatase
MRNWRTAAPPQGESTPALEARVRRWLGGLDRDAEHALVAHAGVVRAIDVILRGRDWDDVMATPVPHLTWRRFDEAAR